MPTLSGSRYTFPFRLFQNVFTFDSTFVLPQVMSDDNCLDAAGADGPVKLVRCHGMGGNQAWVYNKMDK